MKKYSRSLALLLALLMLISVAACSSSSDPAETTEDVTASTTVPETTETSPEVTTEEPSVSVVAPPETSSPETTSAPETTEPPETEPPKATDKIRIIMQNEIGETILSGLAEGNQKDLLASREKALLYDFGVEIELSKTDDLKSKIENLVLAGESKYDLILTDPLLGTEMFASGLLEDVSGAGISISDLPGTIGSITESLSIGGKVYLFSSVALTSDITSTYAVRYDGSPLSSSPAEKVLSGDFTAELMLSYIKENGEIFSLGELSPLTLYRGLGGKIFTKSEGIPTSAVSESTSFTSAYSSALDLYDEAADVDAIFTVEKISTLKSGEIYLPIPRANADLEYSAPLDHETVSVFAAPVGVISGNRLNSLVAALNSCSHNYREGIRSEAVKNGAKDSLQMLDILEANSSLDLGILFGWGNIDDLIEDGLEKGTSAETLISDRMTEMRNKAVDTAAKIVAERLGIK